MTKARKNRKFFYVPCQPGASLHTDVLAKNGLPAGRLIVVPSHEANTLKAGSTPKEQRSGRFAAAVTYNELRAVFGHSELEKRARAA